MTESDDQMLARAHVAAIVAVLRAGGVDASAGRAGPGERRVIVDLLPEHDFRAIWGAGEEYWVWSLMDARGQIVAGADSPLVVDAHPDTVAEVIASYPYGIEKTQAEVDTLRDLAVEILEKYHQAQSRVVLLHESEDLEREIRSYYVRLGLVAE